MQAAGLTHKGQVRDQNQDSIFVMQDAFGPLPNLFIVADGMGGHNAGEIASVNAINFITDYIAEFHAAEFVQADNYLDLLVAAVQYANVKICKMAEENKEYHGMGTTLTACIVTDEKIVIAHVGDSRAYAITPSAITKLTSDHTYIEHMLQTGKLSAEEALTHPKRHVITRVLGMETDIDGLVLPINDTVSILLCSDGLSNMMDDTAIKGIAEGVGFVEHRTRFLVEEANSRGGHDNISAILIDVNR